MIYEIVWFVIGIIIGVIIVITQFNLRRVYKGGNSNIIKKIVYKSSDGLCYRYVPKIYICPISHSMNLSNK